mmetsp:Transcript_3299/g.6750  ORF Transcript_3299/g.6750 Transcript_3299/m.6750 type:complete len:86 (+) Transcript_3299:37-294(+)
MFQALRTCFTTGGICPHREEVVPACVTEGFCGGKRGPKTGIERMEWHPLQFLDEDVGGSLAKAGAAAPGVMGFKLKPYPPLYTEG